MYVRYLWLFNCAYLSVSILHYVSDLDDVNW